MESNFLHSCHTEREPVTVFPTGQKQEALGLPIPEAARHRHSHLWFYVVFTRDKYTVYKYNHKIKKNLK